MRHAFRLFALVACLMAVPYAVCAQSADVAAHTFNIWQGTAVSARVPMTAYIPDSAASPTAAVIVCPGGSYHWHDMQTEGHGVARWLQSHGIAAFVLKYRTAGIFAFVTHFRLIARGHQHPDALRDLQRALQIVGENAARWNIDPTRIGAMGFSAGGHLVMAAAEADTAEAAQALRQLGCQGASPLRPQQGASPLLSTPYSLLPTLSFVAPIYPVVSMTAPCTHRRSRRGLLGEWGKHSRRKREAQSLELHVPAQCPPVFLVNCKDDPIVDYHNSELLDSALTARQVPHLYLQYTTGGHGFGASDTKGTAECRAWRTEFLRWLHRLHGAK